FIDVSSKGDDATDLVRICLCFGAIDAVFANFLTAVISWDEEASGSGKADNAGCSRCLRSLGVSSCAAIVPALYC
ncbi:MAG: hypothetical protein K7J15_05295, partial [Candidatus Regiella insecticola]|nr:hypothetical protein [Candidatus Regiella insecticola]